MKLPANAGEPLVRRLKVMGNAELAETRLPQDFRIDFVKFSRLQLDLDLRAATFPTRHGEACYLRLLAKSSIALGLDALGFTPENLDLVKRATQEPWGV